MTDRQYIYFEIFDSGDFVRLEPIELIKYDSNIDWDKNWVKTKVTVKGGNFSGQYIAEFMTVDFEKFKQELSRLFVNLNWTANFNDFNDYLELKIIGDGLGHFEVNVSASDKPGIDSSKLIFKLSFDQTVIKELVNQLDIITCKYPITGDFKIKNE
jgi:hypothetical protein